MKRKIFQIISFFIIFLIIFQISNFILVKKTKAYITTDPTQTNLFFAVLTNYTATYLLNFIGKQFFIALGEFALTVANFIKNIILYFYTFAEAFFQLILNLNIYGLKNNAVLDTGWKISRDVANLFIIIIIIIIALATILKIKEFEAQKLLINVILIAILINFSLEIGYIIIDFTHSFTLFFQKAAGLNSDQNDFFGNIIQPQKLLMSPTSSPHDKADLKPYILYFFLSLLTAAFIVIFALLIVFVVMTYGIIFLIRYIYLTILLILFPLVLVLNLIPQFKQYSGKWWSKFIEWSFFAPTAMFFLLLSIKGAESLKNNFSINNLSENYFQIDSETKSIVFYFFQYGTQLIVILGFLLGGLMAAQAMQSVGVKFGSNFLKEKANKFKKDFTEKLSNKAKNLGNRQLAKIPDKLTDKMATFGLLSNNKALKAVGTLAGYPIRFLGRSLNKAKTNYKETIDKEKENLKNKSDNELIKNFKSYSRDKRTAAFIELANRNKEKIKKFTEVENKIISSQKDINRINAQININHSIINDPTSSNTEKRQARLNNIALYTELTEKQNEIKQLNQELKNINNEIKNFHNNITDFLPKALSEVLVYTNKDFNLKQVVSDLIKNKRLYKSISTKNLKNYLNL